MRPDARPHLEKVNRSVPVMLVDRSFERTSLPYVCTDNYRGGVEATRILLQRGHRRIACIQGVPHSSRTAGACRVISTRSDKRDCRRKPS